MVVEDPGPAVMVENLSVSFGKVRALAGIDLSVERGEVCGVVGTNGAGKSTLIDVLSGMVKPSSGKVSVLGLDPVHNAGELRRRVGVIPQETSIEDRLSACENLRYFGRLLDVPPEELEDRTEELVRFMGLWERRNDRLESYSVGMKRKIHFACSLMHRPRLLLVDEATAGFDPRIKREVNTLILEMSRKQGVTVLLTTHDLSDARTICDRLAVLHRGSLVCQGTWADLSSGAEAKLVLTGIPPGEEERVSRLLPGEVKESAGRFSVTVSSTSVAFELAEKLERNGIAASSISYEVPAGELFETLTGSAEEEPLDD